MIKTKVAQILSPTQVVLAAGAKDGVKEGMPFIIYELSDVILDPETNEPLGQLELVKGRVEASHVQDKICVATTLTREVSRPRFPLTVFHDYTEVPVKLPVDESVVAVKNDLKVRVGDLVRSVS
jgi:hypothetical protein